MQAKYGTFTCPTMPGADFILYKVEKGDVKVGLRVLVEAKPEKVEEVKKFLIVSPQDVVSPVSRFDLNPSLKSSLRYHSSTTRH